MLKVLVLSLDISPCDNLWELHIVRRLLEMVCTAKCVLIVKPKPILMHDFQKGGKLREYTAFKGLRMPC